MENYLWYTVTVQIVSHILLVYLISLLNPVLVCCSAALMFMFHARFILFLNNSLVIILTDSSVIYTYSNVDSDSL